MISWDLVTLMPNQQASSGLFAPLLGLVGESLPSLCLFVAYITQNKKPTQPTFSLEGGGNMLTPPIFRGEARIPQTFFFF